MSVELAFTMTLRRIDLQKSSEIYNDNNGIYVTIVDFLEKARLQTTRLIISCAIRFTRLTRRLATLLILQYYKIVRHLPTMTATRFTLREYFISSPWLKSCDILVTRDTVPDRHL